MLTRLKRTIKKKIGFEKLNVELEEIRKKTDEMLWGMKFNSAAADSSWLKNKNFNAGGWAAGYPLLYILYRIYNEVQPKSILEMGMGETTKMSCQYANANKDVQLTLVEQDPNWLNLFCKLHYDVLDQTLRLDLVQEKTKGFPVNKYANLLPSLNGKEFDFILTDGPWGSPRYSRFQLAEVIKNGHLKNNFIIILDDTHRMGEKETVIEIRNMLTEKNIKICECGFAGEGESWMLCTENYRYLTTF